MSFIKLIFMTVSEITRLTIRHALMPFIKLYRYINKKRRLSITFKLTTVYASILTALLAIAWTAFAAAFSDTVFGKNFELFGMFIGALMFTFILVILLSILIGSYTARKLLRPINHMIAAVRSITVGALHTRLDVVDSYDELKDLAETFNGMLDRIQASYEQQNRFVSDASHELRTPISVIQGYANLLQRWGMEDRKVMEESIDAIKTEAENMKNLVEKLLFLARADKNTQKIEKSTFPLNELLDEVIKETKLIDSEHDIVNDTNEIILLQGDKGLIKQALRIFIDNSIKYTLAGGKIRINSCRAGNRAILTVEDSGIGISKDDLPHIFDRFYKCDKSRTRGSSSTGLGLSIAKWIVEKHEGYIIAESEIHKGTKIMISLPVLQQNLH